MPKYKDKSKAFVIKAIIARTKYEEKKKGYINPLEVNKQISEILDMPPPWPNRIIIPLKKYNERSPTQTQVYFYEKTKEE